MMSLVVKHARGAFVGFALLVFAILALRSTFDRSILPETTPVQHVPEFVGPVTAEVWGVFDPETGEVLYGNNETSVRPMASITKLFTAAVVMQSDARDTVFTIQESDLAALGRAGRLAVGDKTTSYALLFPLLIESSNDASAAIERVLDPTFDDGMSQLIADVQLQDTVVVDGSGLSPQNVSTLNDLASFFVYLKRTAPHVLDISQLRMYLTENAAYQNNDPARMFYPFMGGKHGYTEEAGHTFLGTFSTGSDGGEVGIVLLGSSDLRADIGALYGFGRELLGSGILETP